MAIDFGYSFGTALLVSVGYQGRWVPRVSPAHTHEPFAPTRNSYPAPPQHPSCWHSLNRPHPPLFQPPQLPIPELVPFRLTRQLQGLAPPHALAALLHPPLAAMMGSMAQEGQVGTWGALCSGAN